MGRRDTSFQHDANGTVLKITQNHKHHHRFLHEDNDDDDDPVVAVAIFVRLGDAISVDIVVTKVRIMERQEKSTQVSWFIYVCVCVYTGVTLKLMSEDTSSWQRKVQHYSTIPTLQRREGYLVACSWGFGIPRGADRPR